MVFPITKPQKLNSEKCGCHIWGRLAQIYTYKGIHGNINLHFSSSEMKRLQYLCEITSSPLKIRCWRADHSLSLLLTVCSWTPAPQWLWLVSPPKHAFKEKKYNNRLIMFTDILKMCFFFRLCSFSGPITRNFLRSKSTNFMTQVNNCMFIFSEIKCDFQSKVVKFVTKINSVKVIFKNYLVFSLYLWGTQWLLLE